jgi:hypothetical protein
MRPRERRRTSSRFGRRSAAWEQLPARALALVGALGCSAEADGVSFATQIKPLFDQRCAICHFTGNGYADLQDPFNPEHGLVGGTSIWWENHDYGPEHNVLPFEPDQSFVLEKLTNPALSPEACVPGSCLPEMAGFHMPPAPRRLTDEQRALVRQWILEGADPVFFQDNVKNIFGNRDVATNDPCRRAGSAPGCNQCIACHRADGPFAPYGFDPEVDLIGVTATFRSDLKLVEPGNPDASFLMMKLDAERPSSEWGGPMPYGYPSYSESEVAVLRQWIAEGARNN